MQNFGAHTKEHINGWSESLYSISVGFINKLLYDFQVNKTAFIKS